MVTVTRKVSILSPVTTRFVNCVILDSTTDMVYRIMHRWIPPDGCTMLKRDSTPVLNIADNVEIHMVSEYIMNIYIYIDMFIMTVQYNIGHRIYVDPSFNPYCMYPD